MDDLERRRFMVEAASVADEIDGAGSAIGAARLMGAKTMRSMLDKKADPATTMRVLGAMCAFAAKEAGIAPEAGLKLVAQGFAAAQAGEGGETPGPSAA